MPCNDGPNYNVQNYIHPNEQNRIDLRIPNSNNYNNKINMSQSIEIENTNLKASLCAIFTELENKNLEYIIKDASISGMIDLNDFWENHKKEDIKKIDSIINSLSYHEQKVLKKRINILI